MSIQHMIAAEQSPAPWDHRNALRMKGWRCILCFLSYQSFKENVHFPHNAVEMAQPGKALDC